MEMESVRCVNALTVVVTLFRLLVGVCYARFNGLCTICFFWLCMFYMYLSLYIYLSNPRG